MQAAALGVNLDSSKCITGDLAALPFAENYFEATFSINVLHLAKNGEAFYNWFNELFRVTAPNGYLIIKMMASKGIEHPKTMENGLYRLPDNSVRFLFNDAIHMELESREEVTYAEPIRFEIIPGLGSWVFMVIRKKN